MYLLSEHTIKQGSWWRAITLPQAHDLAWGSASSSASGSGLIAGKWSSINVDWVVTPGKAAIGKYLYVDLAAGSNNYVYYDNVGVTFTPAPEPSGVVMLCLGVAGLWLSRRLLNKA